MKFYKISKELLKWTEMPQTNLPLRVPLLIDTDYNVLLGNCLKDRVGDQVLVVIVEKWDYYNKLYPVLEQEIFEADDPDKWLWQIDEQVCRFLKDEVTINEQVDLFKYQNKELLSESNYRRGGAYNFIKAKTRKSDEDDDQIKLFQFEDEIERAKAKEDDIVIDLEILKEIYEES